MSDTEFLGSGSKLITNLSAGALNADLLPSLDVSPYKWWTLQINGTYTGVLTWYGSNDASNWTALLAHQVGNANAYYNNATSVTGLFECSIEYRYLLIRMTSYTSGTATGLLTLYSVPLYRMHAATSCFQNGSWTMQNPTASAALSTISASTSSVSLLASNGSRKGACIYNNSSSALYIAYAGTATTTSYTNKIAANSFFQIPSYPVYTGAISGIWDTATGNAQVTELS